MYIPICEHVSFYKIKIKNKRSLQNKINQNYEEEIKGYKKNKILWNTSIILFLNEIND